MITGSVLIVLGMLLSFHGATGMNIGTHFLGCGIAGVGAVLFVVMLVVHFIPGGIP